jgi:hypothetical protein
MNWFRQHILAAAPGHIAFWIVGALFLLVAGVTPEHLIADLVRHLPGVQNPPLASIILRVVFSLVGMAVIAFGVFSKRGTVLRPDWSIGALFRHIQPDITDASEKRLKEAVGQDVIDRFSTGQLKVWGRLIEWGTQRRLSLTEISTENWQRAQFTYWFLTDEDGQAMDVACYRSSPGSAPLQYADLRVNRAQALTIWRRGSGHRLAARSG